MANSPWQTGRDFTRREQIHWPNLVQLLQQVGLAVLVVVLWAGLLVGFLRLTEGGPQSEAVAVVVSPTAAPTSLPAATATSPPEAVAVAVSPTATPTPLPTATPTPQPTNSPTNTATVSGSAVPVLAATTSSEVDPPTLEPSPTSTFTPTPSPTPTDTPIPTDTAVSPTDTPVPPTDTPTPVAAGSAEVSYANDVFPIIERRCIKCHGGPKDDGTLRIEEGLDLRTYATMLAGSFNGPVIEPGNAADSYLVELITKGDMPKKEPRLLPGEIRTISAWIEAGAPEN